MYELSLNNCDLTVATNITSVYARLKCVLRKEVISICLTLTTMSITVPKVIKAKEV